MPNDKTTKRLIRSRMKHTGETYTNAMRTIVAIRATCTGCRKETDGHSVACVNAFAAMRADRDEAKERAGK